MIFDHVPAWMMVHGTLYAFANEGFEAAHKRNKQLFNKGDRGGGKYGSLDGVIKNIFLKLYRTQLLVWAQDNLDEEEAEAKAKHNFYFTALKVRLAEAAARLRQRASRAAAKTDDLEEKKAILAKAANSLKKSKRQAATRGLTEAPEGESPWVSVV
jgi:hypothetical protein